MLNEIYSLYKSLENCGSEIPISHPWVKQLPKSEGFIVGINNQGFPASIEYFDKESSRKLWKIEKDNHNTFPAFKLTRPLFSCSDVSRDQIIKLKKDDTKSRIQLLNEIKNQSNELNIDMTVFWRLLTKVPFELTKELGLLKNSKISFEVLIERLKNIDQDQVEKWLKEFANVSIVADIINDASYLLQQAFIGNKFNERKNRWECDVMLFLDVADYSNFDFLVRDGKTRNWILENIIDNNGENKEKNICSLEVEMADLEKSKFPNPNLAEIGPVFLYSQNSDIPCQFRYGKASMDAFPVGINVLKKLDGVMKYIAGIEQVSKKGKTWIGIPDGANGRALLISYLIDNPKSDIENALLLGGETNDALRLNFEGKSSSIISALKGLPVFENQLVRTFVIRKADKGRAQIVLSETFAVGNIIKASQQWIDASNNHPNFKILVFQKEKGSPQISKEPFPPFPMDIVRHLQQIWVRGGRDSIKASSCQLRDAFDFFLHWGDDGIDITKRLLSLLLKRSTSLLIGIGQALHAGIESYQLKEFNNEARFSVLKSLSLISISLYKLGLKKEEYMKNPAFLIGRLLSTADGLHKEYCKLVRKGQIPPQLIGNALIPTALDSPERALSSLLERMRIYQGWANTVQGGEEVRLAKWFLRQMGEISTALGENDLPKRMLDKEKAQLLLGYLAWSENSEQKKN